MVSPIKVAIIGVGNCANSFVQGIPYYRNVTADSPANVGLIHNSICGYLPRHIQIVAAFDVNANKIGKDLSEAIWAEPNNSLKFSEVPPQGVAVSAGFIGDGIAPHIRNDFPLCEEPGQVEEVLRRSGARIAINYLPVGSQMATEFYAQCCLNARVGFINGMPVFVASYHADPKWKAKFAQAGVLLMGDDWKSHFGATLFNELLLDTMRDLGFQLTYSWQRNIGGNYDFKNMQDKERVATKVVSKKTSLLHNVGVEQILAEPADYVPELLDQKIANIKIEGNGFGGAPLKVRCELSVQDSPNAAAVSYDVVRLMQVALDRGLHGPLSELCAAYFKSPPEDKYFRDARDAVKRFIAG